MDGIETADRGGERWLKDGKEMDRRNDAIEFSKTLTEIQSREQMLAYGNYDLRDFEYLVRDFPLFFIERIDSATEVEWRGDSG
jgi:hypothetical protein